MNIPDECKECKEDCKIAVGPAFTTTVDYMPIYDKRGFNVNPDGNTVFGGCKCLTCNKQWKFESQYGKTVWTRIYEN